MIILITGASHTGKTMLAQKMLEKYGLTDFMAENKEGNCDDQKYHI